MAGETPPTDGQITGRLALGDVDAAKELTGRLYERISRIASVIYQQSFPGLKGRHDLESVLGEAWVRLLKAVERTHPRTVDDVFKLAVRHVRFAFVDVIEGEAAW